MKDACHQGEQASLFNFFLNFTHFERFVTFFTLSLIFFKNSNLFNFCFKLVILECHHSDDILLSQWLRSLKIVRFVKMSLLDTGFTGIYGDSRVV